MRTFLVIVGLILMAACLYAATLSKLSLGWSYIAFGSLLLGPMFVAAGLLLPPRR